MDIKQEVLDATMVSRNNVKGLPNFFNATMIHSNGQQAEYTIKRICPLDKRAEEAEIKLAHLFSGKGSYFPQVCGVYGENSVWKVAMPRRIDDDYYWDQDPVYEYFDAEESFPTQHLVLENQLFNLNEEIKEMMANGQSFTNAGQYQIINSLVSGMDIVHREGYVFDNIDLTVLMTKNGNGSCTAKLATMACISNYKSADPTAVYSAMQKDIWKLGITSASVLLAQPIESIPLREHAWWTSVHIPRGYFLEHAKCATELRDLVYTGSDYSCLRLTAQATTGKLLERLSMFASTQDLSMDAPAVHTPSVK